jgi:hypothetical protein
MKSSFSVVTSLCIELQTSTVEISNAAAKAVTLLLRVRNIPGSSVGPHTGYPNRSLSWVSSLPLRKFQGSTLNQAMIASCKILSSSLFINHPIIRPHTVWATDTVVKWTTKTQNRNEGMITYICVATRSEMLYVFMLWHKVSAIILGRSAVSAWSLYPKCRTLSLPL